MNLFIAVACGIFIFLLLYILIMRVIIPQNEIKARVHGLQHAASFREELPWKEEMETEASFRERVLRPLQHKIENNLLRLTPKRIYAMLEQRLMYAGKQYVWSVNFFAGVWVITACFSFGIAFFLAFSRFHMPAWQGLALVLPVTFIGGALPLVFLDMLISRRKKEILRQLPQVLDLLCVSVQAGLSFDGAMMRLVENMEGALIEECDKLLRDMRMGMPRREALNHVAVRCNLQEVQLFMAAIIQSERLGVSMGKTLMVQAKNMRDRRQQHIKAMALKAPVKMLFPLAVFMFPTIFVVVLLPVALSLLHHMGSFGK